MTEMRINTSQQEGNALVPVELSGSFPRWQSCIGLPSRAKLALSLPIKGPSFCLPDRNGAGQSPENRSETQISTLSPRLSSIICRLTAYAVSPFGTTYHLPLRKSVSRLKGWPLIGQARGQLRLTWRFYAEPPQWDNKTHCHFERSEAESRNLTPPFFPLCQ